MKKMMLLFFITLSQVAWSWEALEFWNQEFEQELVINCDPGELLCQEKCGRSDQCLVKASFCKNCVGSGPLLSYFYQNVGSWFVNSGIEWDLQKFQRYLTEKKFILLTSSSPYNIYTGLNDPRMEKAFHLLCPGFEDPYPVVLAELNANAGLEKISAVICHGEEGARVYTLNSLPPVIIFHQLGSTLENTLHF